MAKDEFGGVLQRPLAQFLAAWAHRRIDEAEQALLDGRGRQAVQIELVGEGRPAAFTIDERAALHLEQVSSQPRMLNELFHLRIARVQPVTRPVEGKTLHDVGAAEAAQAILGFYQESRGTQLARAREPGETPADDERASHPARLPRKRPIVSLAALVAWV